MKQATDTSDVLTRVRGSDRGLGDGRRPRKPRRRRVLKILAVVLVLFLIPVTWSYVHAVTAPGSAGVGAQSVEWLRDHGFSTVVNSIESWWYSHHQPPKGGRPAAGLIPKHPKGVDTTSTGPAHLPPPSPIVPLATPALPGEGAWSPIGRTVDGVPTTYAAFLRPDPVHTSLVTGIAWMDTKLLRATLYSGTEEPGGTWQHMAPIPASEAPTLDAAFNSGFRLDASNGGYYTEGRTAQPLVNGAASLVIFTDGTATVGEWGRDVNMGPGVASVRQNLQLIVDNGAPVPGLQNASSTQWGATLGNALYVWRSGVGVTASGALVYAGGPGLSAYTLANVLARAGAIRAMELDINTEWVDYYHYDLPLGSPATADNGTKLLPTMDWPVNRYFQPSERDFITMNVKSNLLPPPPVPSTTRPAASHVTSAARS